MDKVLKQRLVGASILIALAVIFLPMLFHGGAEEGAEQRELALDLPEREAGDRRVRRLALNPDEARRPAAASQPDPSTEATATESEPRERRGSEIRSPQPRVPTNSDAGAGRENSRRKGASSDEPAETVPADAISEPSSDSALAQLPEPTEAGSEANERQPEPAPAEPPSEEEPVSAHTPAAEQSSATAEAGSWVVQVAVFSNRQTADQIRQRLNDLGHRASMDVLVRDQAELFRLRTGPYTEETEAAEARGQIAATVAGVDPVVRELSQPGQQRSGERSGLAVQVGSFASRNNAERLSSRLSDAGFDAFMFSEQSGGRSIWRVRVGTHEERAEAEALLETLRAEQGLDGIVVSHP